VGEEGGWYGFPSFALLCAQRDPAGQKPFIIIITIIMISVAIVAQACIS
jgi:hypothetical protein